MESVRDILEVFGAIDRAKLPALELVAPDHSARCIRAAEVTKLPRTKPGDPADVAITENVQGFTTAVITGLTTATDHALVFAFIIYKSKADRNRVNKLVHADPRMQPEQYKTFKMPFDMKRFAFGGFKTREKAGLEIFVE